MTDSAEQQVDPNQNELVVEATETQEAPAPETVEEQAPPEQDQQPEVDEHRSRAQERIRDLIEERKAIAEYAEYWRRKALEGTQPPAQDQKPADDPAPTPEQFGGDMAKWAAAHAEWTQRAIERKAEEKAKATLESIRSAEQLQQAETSWKSRLEEFAKQRPDAWAVIGNPTFTQTDTMAKVIKASPRGPELAYYLGSNPLENERIKRLSPEMQAAELGRLEATLSAQPSRPAAPKPVKSKAPPPPNPIEGGGSPEINLETCSLDEYLEARLRRKTTQRARGV
jgi:hypothetical protein